MVGIKLPDQFSLDGLAVNQVGVLACRRLNDEQGPLQMSPQTLPTSYLDKAVFRVALSPARELVVQGRSADEAARLACPGSWSQWSGAVRAQLDGDGGAA